ncbi:MAG: UDP-N-acetylglucosamine 1-carboxyvinyltransferase [Acidobacteriota bacterium]|nr:UDP-N-acetylglucosamine 1-carboxyvinyltransferase [Blastocatellia bacterium]MDW8239226.1 UDP-N-acetylglucosamine 1-carboxyvinyltransferase [Acidobacteriota bacterium]
MNRWIIQGGQPLRGRVTISGAKNVAFKLMIAALLGRQQTTLSNVPDVGDVHLAATMIELLGGRVERLDRHTLRIDPRGLTHCTIPSELAKQSRASFMFIGPLIARCEHVTLPLPGGDPIGKRPLDRHLAGLLAMGAEIDQHRNQITVRGGHLKAARYRFPKNTHTGTETLILVAVRVPGQTILENAAQEPEVDDLIAMLNKMGAQIRRAEPRTIVIDGVDELQGADHQVMSDRNEVVSFACMTLATQGDVWIDRVQPEYLGAFLEQLERIGAGMDVGRSSLHVWYQGPLRPTNVVTAPYPGFMTDWQPLLTTLMTQAHGTSVIHETVFEQRFGYVQELREMGANIELFNPPVEQPEAFYNFNWEDNRPDYQHAARIHGPTLLHGIRAEVKDVRAGATLVQAALTAQGETILSGVEHIERGYEDLDERLRKLGALITSMRSK